MDKHSRKKLQAEQISDRCLNKDSVMELVGFFELLIKIDRRLNLNEESNEIQNN